MITDEDILLEGINKRRYTEYPLGSADYWKQEGWNEAIEEVESEVRRYLEEKKLI